MRLITILALLVFSSQLFAKQTFSFMNYNVENLFDVEHDNGKEDWTYLPLEVKRSSPEIMAYCKSLSSYFWRKECYQLDWNQEVLDKKLHNIGEVIKSYNDGRGPDIVVLEEVENLNVLTQLRDKELADQGYISVVLLEGPDQRGIDVGMLSRFPVEESKLHEINLSSAGGSRGKETRGILEVTYWINNHFVVVLGNHWPSQGNPSSVRYKVAEKMREIAEDMANFPIISTGDFNTLDSDSPHGLNNVILNNDNSLFFYDVQSKTEYFPDLGSHWYRGKWTYLDKILVSNNLNGLIPLWDTFDIHNPDFVLTYDFQEGEYIPYRSNHYNGKGYSDHLGITMKFQI